ncbi:thymidine phosphorylase [Segniliparus rugosus]|uniref:Pyrimidine-nucleoside phosphorylase n=1 Tax=Segniliparus rugosus (strain ATCC BAA-974 / DSM 45345 / CCUG 50838 / CIP 108380 / JCM 13579 / CDC 945) TaxID=679197 RepID=U1N541_SEGRC|nr:thymidine phosphorylase [Segniliparus rugosus]ERG69289.1 pyrimidine-nucleoside phosphorylase [Segniliparus rugosus ATCC BAA-974]
MTDVFDAVSIIAAKRDGNALTDGQIDWTISNFAQGKVADEQMAALAMAVFLNGLDRRELVRWTQAMIDSGERLDLSGLSRPTVDKHSTGGVGDKITLPLTPLVAACGAAVPQLSGRGLGHTGGTLDKLESIPGWSPFLSPEAFTAQLEQIGGVVAAASSDLAPADRRLYALRDVTGTVESIPLIASSIMSKKIAEGTGALVLDVKVGSGAFMRDAARARELAETMVAIGTDAGVRTTALLTGMDTPLGFAVGNAVEVAESVDVLRGGGPSDVRELTLVLAEEMLRLAGIDADPRAALDSGAAYEAWRAMVRAQGGDPDAPLPKAAHQETVLAPRSGRVVAADARGIGVAAWRLGAGRERQGDPVSFGAGVLLAKRPGDLVEAGEPLATMLADDKGRFDRARGLLAESFAIADPSAEFSAPALILDRVD